VQQKTQDKLNNSKGRVITQKEPVVQSPQLKTQYFSSPMREYPELQTMIRTRNAKIITKNN